jgi:hypothetical protein
LFEDDLKNIGCIKGIDKYVKTLVWGFRTLIKQKFITYD